MSRLRRAGYVTLRRLSGPWRAMTDLGSRKLRILAYHDVPDSELFGLQMSHLAEHYRVVPGPLSTTGTGEGPSVWVTFDDGDPTLVDNAMEVLSDHGFSATAFICPGVIGTREPYWWQVVHGAAEAGLSVDGREVSPHEVTQLKQVPDPQRRHRVSEIRQEMSLAGEEGLVRRQLTEKDLKTWADAGHSLGNHSWDHPILDQCDSEEQRRQLDLSHQWFLDHGYEAPCWFAYPNGNWSRVAEDRLTELGYESALLFDHRLASMSDDLNLSRIRVNATDSLDEFASKVSGIHPAVMSWRLR